jgi:hypothetical protein
MWKYLVTGAGCLVAGALGTRLWMQNEEDESWEAIGQKNGEIANLMRDLQRQREENERLNRENDRVTDEAVRVKAEAERLAAELIAKVKSPKDEPKADEKTGATITPIGPPKDRLPPGAPPHPAHGRKAEKKE